MYVANLPGVRRKLENDGSCRWVNVEASEMVVFYSLDFNWVSIKFWMGKCGDGKWLSELFADEGVPVVYVSCVEKVNAGLL